MGSRCRLVGRGVLALGLIAGAGGVVAQPVSGQGQPLRAALMQGQDSRDGAILRVSDAPDAAGETLAGQGAVVSSVAGILSGRIAGSSPDTGTSRTPGPDGTQTVDVTDSSVSVEIDQSGALPGGAEGQVKTTIRYDKCPDASGRIAISFKSVSNLSGAGGGTTTRVTAVVDGTVQFNDDARAEPLQADTRVEQTITSGGASRSVDVSWTRVQNTAVRDQSVNAASPNSGKADVASADRIRALMELTAQKIMSDLESYVEAGNCVTLTAETTPAKRSKVAPSSSFEILARPRAKTDGQPAGGTVVATLEGGSQLDPAGTKVPADARFTYTAPSAANQKATVKLVARSKRGVGLASVGFDTAGAALFASGGADAYHGEGTICDASKPFVIAGSGVTNDFSPSDATSGTYKYAGKLEGFAVWGEGTYTLTLSPDGTSGKLVASGGGSVKTPMGTFRNEGSEIYQLTPAPPCD